MVARSLLSVGAVVFALLGLYFIFADIERSDLESACTVTVIGTLSNEASRSAGGGVTLPPGYFTDYEYIVEGSGYRGHDQISAPPGGDGTVLVHYDPGFPMRSVLELGRWRVILLWGASCLALALASLLVLAMGFPRPTRK